MPMSEWISNNSNVIAIYIAAISALISAITAIAAFSSNRQNRKQYKESIQPQLSMSLLQYGAYLYLKIKNTGKLPAKNIRITLNKIVNNGGFDEFIPDALFSNEFELYPEEIVQGKVAMQGGDIAHQVFPQISITISYNSNGKKLHSYSRTVTYQSAYSEKIVTDVCMDTSSIEDSLDSAMRAIVRMANYLDGRQVAPFDKLNILANQSLRNDLLAAAQKPEEPVKTREDTIAEVRGRKVRRDKDAQ